MSAFCTHCGLAVGEGSQFCTQCGTPATASQPLTQPAVQPVTPSSATAPAAKKGLSGAAKVGIAAIVIIFVGGAVALAGMFYVAHRVSQKFDEVKGKITGQPESSQTSRASRSSSNDSSLGDPCRYLSKSDVSAAIGVEIVKTQADDEACSYLAKGTGAEMAAKHASAMLGSKGADAQTQKMAEMFGKVILSSSSEGKNDGTDDGSGNVPVFSVSVSNSASATAEMNLNAKTLKNLGGGKTGEDLNIGDQAFMSADGMIMVRKGGKIIRIMYMTCPCSSQQVIPLAKKLVDSL